MDKKEKISVWDFLIWAGIILILGWALLKAFGVIHSPVWVDMIPYFGVGGSAVGGAYKLGKIMRGIENTNEKVDRLLEIEDRFKKLEVEHNLHMTGKVRAHKNSF
jgi:hypothetical protein